jgi:hypothetical protein
MNSKDLRGDSTALCPTDRGTKHQYSKNYVSYPPPKIIYQGFRPQEDSVINLPSVSVPAEGRTRALSETGKTCEARPTLTSSRAAASVNMVAKIE